MKAVPRAPLENFTPLHSFDLSLALSNLVLVVCAAGILGAALMVYDRRSTDVTVGTNRYLTMEWHFLQQLKAQTDQQLSEKDREINALWKSYNNLKMQDGSSGLLTRLETELQAALKERDDILAAKLTISTDDRPTASTPVLSRTAVEPTNVATGVLEKRIAVLEAQLDQSRQRTAEAEAELARLRADTLAARAVRETPRVSDSESATRTAQMQSLLSLLDLKRAALGGQPAMSFADIKTRSLVRAIVSSSAVSATYPDLLQSLDHYFEVYGQQERLRGQLDAYAAIMESVKAMESSQPEPR